VVNNTAPVRESVRRQVLASLQQLGYEPHSTHSVLSTLANTIALVIPDILNPFFTELIRGVQDEAGSDSLMLLLLDTMEDPQREQQSLKALLNRPVGGVILCASRLPGDELIAYRSRYNVPMVAINRNIDHPEIACVIVDFEQATFRAARHLCDLHHSRIAFLAGPSTSETSQARRRGIESALAEAGIPLRPEYCPVSFPSVDGGFQAMSALLALPVAERPTAAIAYNDIMALGALHAIRAHHLRVPEDISLIGFDDIAMAAHANPPLTTVSQPKYRMGRLAMKILSQLIQEQTTLGEGYTMLESSLVVRESTAPAPVNNGNGAAQ
jgi:LacI family transcriptional regulator